MKGLRFTRRELLASGGAVALAPSRINASPANEGPIAPTWESLAAHYRVPDWFRDAKFGIWAHWGPQYQPAYGYDPEGPMRGRRYDAYWLRKKHGRGKFWEGLDPQELYTGPYYVAPDGIMSNQAMMDWHDKRDGQWIEAAPPFNPEFVR